MFSSVKKWFNSLFRSNVVHVTPGKETFLCRRVDISEMNSLKDVPDGQQICLYRGSRLVLAQRDAVPEKVNPGEVCWFIPTQDVSVQLVCLLGETSLKTTATIRFEPDFSLGELLEGRKEVSETDLAPVISSQLGSLFDMLGSFTPEIALKLDKSQNEKLRAKLSLMLQNRGMRCTGLSSFTLMEKSEKSAVPEEKTVTVDSETVKKAEAELTEATANVKTLDDWEELLDSLDLAGLRTDAENTEKLRELGEQVIHKKITSADAARKIQSMAQEMSQRAARGSQDTVYYDIKGLRMRLENRVTSTPEVNEDIPQTAIISQNKCPKSGWFWSDARVDEQLCHYLNTQFGTIQTLIHTLTSSKLPVTGLIQLREMEKELGLVKDLVRTMTTLTPQKWSWSLESSTVKDSIRHIKLAVTATELVEGALRRMAQEKPGTAEWNSCSSECFAALKELQNQLRMRRKTR